MAGGGVLTFAAKKDLRAEPDCSVRDNGWCRARFASLPSESSVARLDVIGPACRPVFRGPASFATLADF